MSSTAPLLGFFGDLLLTEVPGRLPVPNIHMHNNYVELVIILHT